MKLNQTMRIQLISLFSVVGLAGIFGILILFTTWYFSLAITIMLIVSLILFLRKKSESVKKIFTENTSIIISGTAALSIITFVIYLLVHIFLLGRSNITWTFLTTAPSEGLTAGGIFPAIAGTALLVIIMSVAGVPVGTITAIYLTEYAKEKSRIAKVIRFAVNTLAGVPAIVFGLFGLGFFIGIVGKQIDSFADNSRMAKLEAIFSLPASPFYPDGKATVAEIKSYLEKNDPKYWDLQIELTKSMSEIYRDTKKITKGAALDYYKTRTKPHWGQPALIWAALTMALLTLPVVIVSVEEAIRTVPRDLREASLSLGATKFKTIIKVVLPGSITGILTGGILAVSRGAGEVAPILFTGAAYYLPDLPNSLSSQFMELGYHIYILTTQSTNVELTKPLQYATTFVLLILTFMLNFTAIFLRSRVRARMQKLSR